MQKFKAIKESPWTIFVLFIIQVPLIYWLVVGDKILVKEIIAGSNFPAGTIIAWLFIFSFPMMTFLLLEKVQNFFHPILFRMLKRLGLLAVFCGGLWGIISYFITENWRFNMGPHLENHEARQQAFKFISIFPIFTSFIIGLVIAIGSVVAVINTNRKR